MTAYYADDTVTLLLGDTLETLRTLPDESVNCCVTSPPYFNQRDYSQPGQYGLEATPGEYVEQMRLVFAEVRRVLAVDGTCWINLGDTYSNRPGAGGGRQGATGQRADRAFTGSGIAKFTGIPPKNLLGIPWRVAFALQDDGWYLRAELIWSKRNLMPEAVTDRPTRAHEQIFLLTKSPHYSYDADAIREQSDPEQEKHNQRYAKEYEAHTVRAADSGQPGNNNSVGIHSRPGKGGRNARTVWDINSTPFPGAHFAVFPPEIPRRCILAGCPGGGTVLDPFSGSATTGMVAQQLGRKYIGIDLNPEYHDLALKTRLMQGALPFGGEVA